MTEQMVTRIGGASLLLGEELQLTQNGWIEVEDGTITYAGQEKPNSSPTNAEVALNGNGLLAIPGLIDAHTHIGDSIAKDAAIGSGLNELVHPIHGLKTKLLNNAHEQQFREAVSATTQDMLASGITTFADFREGGLRGVQLGLSSLYSSKQRALMLGRPNYHFNEDDVVDESKVLTDETIHELTQTLDLCYGIGLSGANEYTGGSLKQISEIARSKGKLLAIHVAESVESGKFSREHFSATELERVLRHMQPDVIVHLTNSTSEDLETVCEKRIPVVCCPRANSILGLGFPPLLPLVRAGVKVALGTDNVMLNAPDMFREMDYTSRILRALNRSPNIVTSKDVLKMATVNAAHALGLASKIGSIEEGKRADLIFLDLNALNLRSSRDLVASVVHRARPDNVKCVMVDGEILHGSIPKS